MSKFGALIDDKLPVLLFFYTEWHEQSKTMHQVLRNVAEKVGDRAKVIKIDLDKNPELGEALRIKDLPAFMIYKKGEMKWRQSGEQDIDSLTGMINKYV